MPIAFRRLLGLFAFTYALLHFSVWVVLDFFFDWAQMAEDIVKRPYITVGMTALTLLIPLAATSTSGMIKRLGARRWRRLHRLAYVSAILGVLHYLWLAKVGVHTPWIYASVLALLLGVRLIDAVKRRMRVDAERSGLHRAPTSADRRATGNAVLGSTRMRIAILALTGVVLLAGCTTTAPTPTPAATSAPAPASTASESGPRREVLPNGLVLITQEHRAADVVALQLWVRVGGRDESAEELGLSHYLEHMLFKGTPTRPPGAIDTLIEGLGGTSNAFTSYDYTHYDVVVPARSLRPAVELLADIGVNASFPPAEIDGEKAVVFEEMRLVEDDPEKFASRSLSQLAYSPHPYGRPILGDARKIEVLTRDPLNAYYKKYYVPRNMALVVVGAVSHAEVRKAVDATFGALPGGQVSRPAVPPPPSLAGGRRADITRSEQQAYLSLGWKAASTSDPDTYAVDLLTYILGDSPSSRLNVAVRERDRLVFSIESNYVPSQQAGLVSIAARMDPANLDRAEASILDVIRRVRNEGVTEAERERAIITAESHYAFDIETAEGLARTYGQGETTWTLADELRYLERLRKVTAAEIQAMARKYLGDDNYARVRFRPTGGAR